jgi:hypothetical protein
MRVSAIQVGFGMVIIGSCSFVAIHIWFPPPPERQFGFYWSAEDFLVLPDVATGVSMMIRAGLERLYGRQLALCLTRFKKGRCSGEGQAIRIRKAGINRGPEWLNARFPKHLLLVGHTYALTGFVAFASMLLVYSYGETVRASYSVGMRIHIFAIGVPATPANISSGELLVGIDKSDRWFLNSRLVSHLDLAGALSDAFRRRPGRAAFLSADSNLTFGEIAEAIDVIRGAHGEVILAGSGGP